MASLTARELLSNERDSFNLSYANITALGSAAKLFFSLLIGPDSNAEKMETAPWKFPYF